MAGNRTVLATLILDGVEGVERGFKRAGNAALGYGKTASSAGGKALDWVDKHQSELDKAASSLLKMGAVGAAALGGLAWAAMDWESAWAGVTKTVDGSAEQMGQLEASLRQMAKELPASHTEIAAVAEAAGQLGVAVDDVASFSRTMIDLGETTNMGSEEAAVSLARLMNIMGTATGEVSRLGSTVVELGNNLATTEGEIVAMGLRISAVGAQMGMSEADVLSLAGALSSVGVEAEAGGTAVSKSMKKIDAAVRDGGQKLEILAETAGMSAEQFSAAWRDDAGMALASFVEGLGGVIAEGGNANALLADLGMEGIRESDSLLRLASATEVVTGQQNLLRESLEMGRGAWDDNTALANEAAQRYETTAAQMKMAINGITDEAITLGQMLLPVVLDVLHGVSSLVGAFAGLDDTTKQFVVGFLGVATAAALVGGSLLKAVTALAGLRTALATLGITARGATAALGAIGLVLAVAGVALGSWLGDQQRAKEHVDSLTGAIRSQGEVLGEASRKLAVDYLMDAGVLDIAREYGASLADVTDAALGVPDAMDRVRESVRANSAELERKIALNEAEMDALSRNAPMSDEQAVRYTQLRNLNEELNAELSNRVSGEDAVTSAIAEHSEATQQATDRALMQAEAMGETADATRDAADASLEDAAAKAEQAAAMSVTIEELRELLEATQMYGNALLKLSGSHIGMESSIASLNDRLGELGKGGKDNAATLDLTTESGRKNQRALDDLASSTMNYIATLHEQGNSASEIAAATERGREAWLNAAAAMGMAESEALDLADAYFAIPEDIQVTIATPGGRNSIEEAEALNAQLRDLPDHVRSEIVSVFQRDGADEAERRLNELARTWTANLVVRVSGIQQAAGRVVAGAGVNMYSAHGNLFEAYGHGGLRENHVAQIAPAGAWRIWAEDETGGEAYIPLANDGRRGRAEDIWREVGRRFGLLSFGYGGITSSSATYNQQRETRVSVAASFPGVRTINDAQEFVDGLDTILAQIGD